MEDSGRERTTGRLSRRTFLHRVSLVALGTAAIPLNVARVNNVLRPVQGDTSAINGGLIPVNGHLTSICESNVLKVPVPGFVTPRPEC